MKKIVNKSMAALFALLLGTMVSCKKETTVNETEMNTTTETDTTVVPATDTVTPDTVNSGKDGGIGDQVP
jgi:hypothetical protein